MPEALRSWRKLRLGAKLPNGSLLLLYEYHTRRAPHSVSITFVTVLPELPIYLRLNGVRRTAARGIAFVPINLSGAMW